MLIPTSNEFTCPICEFKDRTTNEAFAPHELPRLYRIATEVRLTKGQPVFHEGDTAEHLFSVSCGVVRTSKVLADGRRQVTGFLGPGSFLGLSYAGTYNYSADAVNAIRLHRFPKERLIGLSSRIPELERFLLNMAASELAAAQDQILLLGRMTARERMASFLLGRSARGGPDSTPSAEVDLVMSRRDIADYLGLTMESVSRALTGLRRDGLIEVCTARRVVITDRKALERITQGS